MIYDIIIIGAGSGGLNIAGFMNKAGFKVLLIDKTDKNIGGDCLNFGCVPSKSLIHISRLFYNAKLAREFGVRTSGIANISKVMKYIDERKNIIREHENADYFRKKGIDIVLGEAKFYDKRSVEINGERYMGKKIIISTGSRPRKLNIPGIEKLKYGENYFDNEVIFNIKKLPKKLVVIGGGPIGIELGQAFSRLGCKVSIILRGDIFLPKENPEITEILLDQLKKEGIEFYFNHKSIKIENKNSIIFENTGENKERKFSFDAILVAIGRELNLNLNLEKSGIELDKNGKIKIDEYLRTTNKNILVCGDIAGGYQFTHAAELHAGVILNNFFSPIKKKLSYDYFSWVTFTQPEIATFGIGEEELKKRGINYEKLVNDMKDDDRSITENNNGKLILYISKNKILGGSMIRNNAGEIFQELVLANSLKLNIKRIFSKIYPYPTASRINKTIITKHFSNKLNNFSKKILRLMYW